MEISDEELIKYLRLINMSDTEIEEIIKSPAKSIIKEHLLHGINILEEETNKKL